MYNWRHSQHGDLSVTAECHWWQQCTVSPQVEDVDQPHPTGSKTRMQKVAYTDITADCWSSYRRTNLEGSASFWSRHLGQTQERWSQQKPEQHYKQEMSSMGRRRYGDKRYSTDDQQYDEKDDWLEQTGGSSHQQTWSWKFQGSNQIDLFWWYDRLSRQRSTYITCTF